MFDVGRTPVVCPAAPSIGSAKLLEVRHKVPPRGGYDSVAMTATQTVQTPDAGHMQRLGAAAAAELRKTVRIALTDVIGHFVQHLPAGITEAVNRASNPTDRDALTELARSIAPRA